jgi:Malonate decarboxylase, alpha subunit, transporter
MAPYPMRVRIRSSASLNVSPGSLVDVVRFLLVFMFECLTENPGAGAATARSSALDVQANASAHARSRQQQIDGRSVEEARAARQDQVVVTFHKGGERSIVDTLDAVAVGRKARMPVAPVMIYGDDVPTL